MSQPNPERNNAACLFGDRRSRSTRASDLIKRNEAAQLAQDLATQGSWSDSFISRSSDSSDIPDTTMGARPQPHKTTPLEPPPAYTDDRRQSRADDHFVNEGNDADHTDEESQADGAEAPLLDQASEKIGKQCRWSGYRVRTRKVLFMICTLLACVIVGSCLGFVIVRSGQSRSESYQYFPTDNRTTIRQTTDDIRGRYLIQDHLELSTTTGDIDVELSGIRSENATLLISTTTGDITIKFGPGWKYDDTTPLHTEIRSVLGNVKGKIWLANGSAQIVTVTGQQDLRVHCRSKGPVVSLLTQSTTGDQVVAVDNLWQFGSDKDLSNLDAVHRSLGTGSINLQYSHSWQGKIDAWSAAGEVNVERDGHLSFDQATRDRVVGHKGGSEHLVKVTSAGNGNIRFAAWYTW